MFGKSVGFPTSQMFTIAMLLGGIGLVNPSDAAPAAMQSASQNSEPCSCSQTREYTAQPTPAVVELFRAAQDGDEATFMQRLQETPNVADYAVDGKPLLATLLYPPRRFRSDKTYYEFSADEAAGVVAEYRKLLPAKTRMLKAALDHGASASDITMDSRMPPLHMVLLYGSPEMVNVLLEHHADPNLKNLDGRSPLEFLLGKGFEFALRMTYMPSLVNKAERAQMVIALLKAGAYQPYQGLAEKQDPPLSRPAADYLIWNSLMTLTEGGEVVQAMMATGTKPVYDDVAMTPLAYAAWTGNLGGVIALQATTPRMFVMHESGDKVKQRDAWLDAAMYAMRAKNDAILEKLIVPGMPFDQVGPEVNRDELPLVPRPNFPQNTLMEHAIESGQAQWVRRLVKMGVSIDVVAPDQVETPLYQALKRNDTTMAALLMELGADPFHGYYAKEASINTYRSGVSPFDFALQDDNIALVQAFLAKLSKEQKLELNQNPYSPFEFFAHNSKPNALPIAQLLVANGITPNKLNPATLGTVIVNRQVELATYLIEHGAPVEPDRTEPLRTDDAEPGNTPLMEAVLTHQKELMALLIQKGAHPDFGEEGLENSVEMAVENGDIAILDSLLASGGKLVEKSNAHKNPRRLIDYAIASGNMAMVQKVSEATGETVKSACYISEEPLLYQSGYFDALQKLGLSPNQRCGEQAPLTLRMASALLKANPLVGAQAARIVHVFREGKDGGVNLDAIDAKSNDTILRRAVKEGRLDLVDIMLQAGANSNFAPAGEPATAWLAYQIDEPEIFSLLLDHDADMNVKSPYGNALGVAISCSGATEFASLLTKFSDRDCATKHAMSPKDAATANTLPGHYYLKDVRETGSELVLSKDGNFDFSLSYGAVDQEVSGNWQVDGDQVYFTTPHPNYVPPFKWTNVYSTSPIGIGIQLKQEDDSFVVAKLVPDGAASQSGKIAVGDRIVGVGQGAQSVAIDVTGRRLNEVVDMIRGQQDTQVLLDILPANTEDNTKHKIVILSRSLHLERSADAEHVKIVVKYKGKSVRNMDVAVGTGNGMVFGRTEDDGAILATSGEVQGIALHNRSINQGRWAFFTKSVGDQKFVGVRSFTFEINEQEDTAQPFNVSMKIKGKELILGRGSDSWHYVRQ